jgi:hypothetical protein
VFHYFGISVNAGSTSFSAYDLFADNGVNTKLRCSTSFFPNDKLAFNEQIELFSGGFKLEIG